MEHGVVVTKYGKKGAAAQRVLYLDGASMSVAWRDLDARSPGHRRSTSLTNIIKGKREALELAHLIEVGRSGRLFGVVRRALCTQLSLQIAARLFFVRSPLSLARTLSYIVEKTIVLVFGGGPLTVVVVSFKTFADDTLCGTSLGLGWRFCLRIALLNSAAARCETNGPQREKRAVYSLR